MEGRSNRVHLLKNGVAGRGNAGGHRVVSDTETNELKRQLVDYVQAGGCLPECRCGDSQTSDVKPPRSRTSLR